MRSMSKEQALKSFRTYERFLEAEVKGGRVPRELASRMLKEARTNYRNLTHNRELDKLK
jgi:hypothetical protein